MSEEPQREPSAGETPFSRQVGIKETRKLKAQRRAARNIWYGFGMFGLIGWSVVVPTLLGLGLGLWLDSRYPGAHSWTLTLLLAGLVIGCLNAWHWVAREEKSIREEQAEEEGEKHE
jgi:ATP synthase protein I